MPCQLRVHAALDFSGSGGPGGIQELDMVIFQEILTRDAERDSLLPLPGQPRIQPGVRGDFLKNETINKIGGGIPGEAPREIDVRSKLSLHMRVASFRFGHGGGVATSRS